MERLAVMLEGLASRINNHNARLKKNGRLVQHALVCPVLRELGWDAEDPELVEAGYDFGGRSADYALLQDKRPIAAVRTRPLGGKLDGVLDELAGCGVRYCIATDGAKWRVRDTAGPESGDVAFSVVGDPTSVCSKMMVLWRRNMHQTFSEDAKPTKSPKPTKSTKPTKSPNPPNLPNPPNPPNRVPLASICHWQVCCPSRLRRN